MTPSGLGVLLTSALLLPLNPFARSIEYVRVKEVADYRLVLPG